MKICIVTGGTGGHIYPALALAQAYKDQDTNHELLFIGNDDRMEAHLVPQAGFPFQGIQTKGIQGNILNKLYALYTLFFNRKAVRNILETFKPDLVIGFGGYVCVPVILEAKKLGVKTFLHEQNAVAGKANLFLAKHVDGIAASYEANLKQFPSFKTRLIGNPRTYDFKNKPITKSLLRELNLDPKKPSVLFVMGSLGSASINALMGSVLALLDEHQLQCIYVTGKQHYDAFIEANDETKYLKIVPYINQVQAMHEVSLMVTRGGATTAAEIMVSGCPSIIIPSPYVPNNHQYHNAKVLYDAGASILVEEKDCDVQRLSMLILDLTKDSERLNSMRAQAKAFGRINAAEDFIAWIDEVM
jgi:UDP-N-acetylglucosamine--N-acetylmuramyl-(pentapeptide) pyrophosphoryl-undecaprenol N-acetylglucosamine transferase